MVSSIPEKLAETVGFFPALPVGAVFGVTRAAFFRGYRGKGFRGYPLLFFSRLPGVLLGLMTGVGNKDKECNPEDNVTEFHGSSHHTLLPPGYQALALSKQLEVIRCYIYIYMHKYRYKHCFPLVVLDSIYVVILI